MVEHTRREVVQNELRYNSPEEVLDRMTESGWDRDKVIQILKEEADDYEGPRDEPDNDGPALTFLREHQRVFVLAGVVVLGLLVGGVAAQYSPSSLFGPSTDNGDGSGLLGDDDPNTTDGNGSGFNADGANLSTDASESVFQRTSPVDVVASDRLLAYWPLDEYRDGTTPDMSGNGYHLEFWGSEQTPSGPSIAEGRHGRSISLCENCWGQTTTDPAGLNRSTMTITFWLMPETAIHGEEQNTDILIGKVYDGAGPNFQIGGADTTIDDPADGWTNLYVRRTQGSDQVTVGTEQEQFSADSWHHVAVEFDDRNISIYVNGEKDIERRVNETPALEDRLDELNVGGSAFTGQVDDLRIYEGILSTDHLQTIMDGD